MLRVLHLSDISRFETLIICIPNKSKAHNYITLFKSCVKKRKKKEDVPIPEKHENRLISSDVIY